MTATFCTYPVDIDEINDGHELAVEGVRRQVDEADTAQFDVALFAGGAGICGVSWRYSA